jgi:alpha-glutamyl/putrescinyl thymine pyrophosphorylase-like protein
VPTFCRHNRLEANCPICSRKAASATAPSRPVRRPESRAVSTPSKRRPSPRAAGDLRVRRMARAVDDGYEHDLLPGLRATVEAARLADELAFATGRLEQLRTAPPGLYADVALLDDREEAAWLAFQIVYISPREGADPFAEIDRVRTTWEGGHAPDLEDVEPGPRTAHDSRRGDAALAAYRAWAARAGSQDAAFRGDEAWTPQRRFERAFERLALPGFGRGPRYELLVVLGALGVFDVRPWSLHLADAMDPTTVAAKRVFGIGDAMNLQRRASDLATATGVPIEALDLALVNWARPPGDRITAGAAAVDDAERREALRAVLHAHPPEAD